MKVYEYRLHRTPDGFTANPSWVENGGHFWNGSTYLAVVPEEADRSYYVPDTLVEFSQADVVARMVSLQDTEERQVDPTDSRVLTTEEVTAMAETWWTENVGV